MTKKNVMSILISMGIIALGAGCNNTPAPPTGPCGSTTCYTSITPEQFVTQLVQLAKDGKINAAYSGTTLAKEVTEQPNTFIIWDGDFGHYVVVNTSILSNETFNNGAVSGDASLTAAMGYTEQTNPLVVVNPIGPGPDGIEQYQGSNGTIYANNALTKDVDLQRAQVQQESLIRTAAAVSAAFQMDFSAAVKITQLSDRIKAAGAQNLTDADRAAIMNNLMGIAGTSDAEVAQTVVQGLKGDNQAVNTLLTKISTHLGMPSSTVLRDRLLPALGVNISN